jgi:hypothetical protein
VVRGVLAGASGFGSAAITVACCANALTMS